MKSKIKKKRAENICDPCNSQHHIIDSIQNIVFNWGFCKKKIGLPN